MSVLKKVFFECFCLTGFFVRRKGLKESKRRGRGGWRGSREGGREGGPREEKVLCCFVIFVFIF